MNAIVQAVQRALIARGYDLGPTGDDGKPGEKTWAAIKAALVPDSVVEPPSIPSPAVSAPALLVPTIPAVWMPDADMTRIIFHWTAGQNKASALDKEHYHLLIEGDAKLIKGDPSIALNSEPKAKPGYAQHTLNCNTGSIGVSLCGMALATESPFNPGKQPITRVQWSALASVLAQLCKRYGIKVDRRTVLSHAEVQETLGIKQKGKWDVSRLPFNDSIRGSIPIGDQMRAMVKALL